MMIVDDCACIVGSANINDRSMLGNRDSEIAVVISGGRQADSVIDGRRVKVSQFVQGLRIRAWEEHLGVRQHPPVGPHDADHPVHRWRHDLPAADLRDVCDLDVYRDIWMATAAHNTEYFVSQYPATRPFTHPSHKAGEPAPRASTTVVNPHYVGPPPAVAHFPEEPRGHLVWFSYAFGHKHDLSPAVNDKEFFVPIKTFQ